MTLVSGPQVNKASAVAVEPVMRGAWVLSVILLWVCQGAFSYAVLQRFHYEDLAESIRNPYWLSHHILYDGTSSNVGWYGSLLAVYELFGFTLHTAKVFRWAFHLLTLGFTAALLLRYVGSRRGLVLLWIVGLSPTLLFMTSEQTSFGFDLQLLPIILWLMVRRALWASGTRGVTLSVVVGALCLWGAFCYPVMLLHAPALAALYVFLWRRSGARVQALAAGIAGVVVGAALVLGGVLAWLRHPLNLLRDPHSGEWSLFTGGGGAMHLDPRILHYGAVTTFTDLFVRGASYTFELPHVELGTPLGWLAVGILTVVAFTQYTARWVTRDLVWQVLSLALLAFLVGLIIPHTSQNAPGIRRATPLLLGFWVAMGVLLTLPTTERAGRWVWRGSLLLLLHHGLVFPLNVSEVATLPLTNDHFLGEAATPEESLAVVTKQMERGEVLRCPSLGGACRYSEIYAAIAGHRAWNDLSPVVIRANDPERDEVVELGPEVWERYRLAH